MFTKSSDALLTRVWVAALGENQQMRPGVGVLEHAGEQGQAAMNRQGRLKLVQEVEAVRAEPVVNGVEARPPLSGPV